MTKVKQTCAHCGELIINPKSRWQEYCDDCQTHYAKHISVKGGNEMEISTQTEMAKQKDKVKSSASVKSDASEKTKKEHKTAKETVHKREWANTKAEYVDKVIVFVKELCKGETDTKTRSVFSGAYFKFNAELKNNKK